MKQEEFHLRYEEEAEHIYATLSKLSEDELLAIIADPGGGRHRIWDGNDNYQVWQVFRVKGTVKSIRPLFDIVSNLGNKYLVRYHACAALFTIAGISDDDLLGEVRYGLNKYRERVDQRAAIDRLEGILRGMDV